MAKIAEKPMVRARIAPKRKKNAEAILAKLGISPSQAINMLYAQIELKHGLPFAVVTEDNNDLLAPMGHVAETLDELDKTDYSYLSK